MRILIAIACLIALGVVGYVLYEPSEYFNADAGYYNVGADGLGVGGYDLVAYHQSNAAIKGEAEFAYEYDGVTYHFINNSNLETFSNSPERYLPAYGGYCSFGLAMDVGQGMGNNRPGKYPADPESFKIIDGKLHLFYADSNVRAINAWNRLDELTLMNKANTRWELIGKP